MTYIDFKTYNNNPDYDVRIKCEGGSSSTPGKGLFTVNCGGCIINAPIYSPYFNNTKTYNIKGKNYKLNGINYNSYYVSPDKITYTTSSFALPVDTDCFSISLIYSYYTTAINNYQGMKKYGIMKYNGDVWFVNTNTSSIFGTLLCQPSMNVTNGYLNATFANASNIMKRYSLFLK